MGLSTNFHTCSVQVPTLIRCMDIIGQPECECKTRSSNKVVIEQVFSYNMGIMTAKLNEVTGSMQRPIWPY